MRVGKLQRELLLEARQPAVKTGFRRRLVAPGLDTVLHEDVVVAAVLEVVLALGPGRTGKVHPRQHRLLTWLVQPAQRVRRVLVQERAPDAHLEGARAEVPAVLRGDDNPPVTLPDLKLAKVF